MKMSDMTKGPILPVMLSFAVPIMLGYIFQDIYSLADMSIAGYVMGDHALAAISATSGLFTLVNATGWGFNVGNSILMSNSFGSGDLDKTRCSFAAMIELCIITALFLTISIIIFINPLLRLLATPESLFHDARIYIITIICGTLAQMIYNLYGCAFRAVGNSKAPLIFLIICSILNIILDYFFMVPLGLGVFGAALATILSQLISAILSAVSFYRSFPELRITGDDLMRSGTIIRNMLPFGISSALTNSVFALGTVAIQGAVNTLGADTIIAQSATKKIEVFAIVPSISIANTMATFSAQNYGARKLDRISRGVVIAILFNIACNIISFSFIYYEGAKLVQLITNTQSKVVISQAETMLRIICGFIFCQTAVMTYRMSIQGMQRKVIPIMGTAIELVIRCTFALVITPIIGFTGIAWAEPASWIISGAVMAVCFYIIMGKETAKIKT